MQNSPFTVRGLVEGFYGPFYTCPERNDLVRFLGRYGYTLYLYGPKNDRWHRERWRTPYPHDMMVQFAKTIAIAEEVGVSFGYAISPGLSITYASDEDFALITRKLARFYEHGTRTFGLFLDDTPSHFPSASDAQHYPSLAHAHVALGNRLYEWLQVLDTSCTLYVCPHVYYGHAPFPDYLHCLGEGLHPEIDVLYTGPATCSETISRRDADDFADAVRRRPVIWDNYPVNDLAMRAELHLGPVRGRDAALYESVRGVVVNPMLETEASKIPLLTYAAYLRDPHGYVPEHAWQQALVRVGGHERADALRSFAENGMSTGLGAPVGETLARLVGDTLDELHGEGPSLNGRSVRDLERYLAELDEACYELQTRLPNLPLRTNLLPWIDVVQRWVWMAQRALSVLEALEHGEPYGDSLRRTEELLAEAQGHHKRVACAVLAPLAEYTLQRVDREDGREEIALCQTS